MLACVRSAMLFGVEGLIVDVQVHVSAGLPGYTVVGLPDAAVRESRDRVRAALLSSGLSWPLRRVTVNLAPSGVRKSGPGLDFPFALGLMMATDELPGGVLDGVGVIGELGLDGSLRPIPGVLAMVDALRRAGTTSVLLPAENAPEASLVTGMRVLPATSLAQARAALKGEEDWPPPAAPSPRSQTDDADDDIVTDLSVVRGLAGGRRALEVAAAGGHHLFMVGPAGGRQDAPGPVHSVGSPSARRRRGSGGHPDPLRRRPAPARPACPIPSLQGAPPHRFGGRSRRRRPRSTVAGGGHVGAQGCPLSRRVG